MVFILLVTENAEDGARMRESLGLQGWWITVVGDREGALRAAADQEPEVVIVDATTSGAAELVRIFSSQNGGPGTLVLSSPEGLDENLALVEAGADEVVSSSPPPEELIHAVERVAAIPHQSTTASPLPIGRQLTADEIFGDILSEVGSKESESAPKPKSEALLEKSEQPPSAVPAAIGVGGTTPEADAQGRKEGPPPGLQADPVAEAEPPVGVRTDPPAAAPEEIPDELSAELGGSHPDVVSGVARSEVSGSGLSEPPPARSRELTTAESGATADSDFGQYRLEERVAVGGMAEVWRASMVGLEGFRKTVAIKKILPHLAENEEFVTMFVDEAKLAAQLSHENLVDIYDLGKIDGDFFIAMEFVDGKDLRSILNRLRRRQEVMPLGFSFLIAARISAALDYAHTRLDADGSPVGLVHRDVSPRNILISHNGNVRLCDFGVAKAVTSVARTEIGALKGKIQYMSPEQAAGERVDARSDVFSLGSVLFEMVTGRRLFMEDTEITLLDAVRRGVTEEPRSVRADLPEDVNAVVVRALRKDPASRYQSAGEMQRALDEAFFKLAPTPTQGALAQWMQGIFEDPEKSEEQASNEAVAGGSALPAVSRGSGASGSFQPEASPTVLPGTEEVSAETKVTRSFDRGRRKFWFGVAAGLLLAIVLALALNFWVSRTGRPSAPPARRPERAPAGVSESLPGSAPNSATDEAAAPTNPVAGDPDSLDNEQDALEDVADDQ